MVDQICDPIDIVFDAARDIAKRRMRPHQHEHVREAGDLHAEIGFQRPPPFLFQALAADAAQIDAVEAAGDCVEPGGVDDDVEFVMPVAGLDTGRRDPLDRRLQDADQIDIGLVVGLVIEGLLRHAPRPEAVIGRDQQLGRLRIVDALSDLAGDEVGDQPVRLAVHQDVAEIADPHGEAGLGILLFPEGLALRLGHVHRLARVGAVHETGERFLAAFENVGVVLADFRHLRLRDRLVAQRLAPVRAALKDGQMSDRLGYLLDGLHAGRTRTDHRDPLAGIVDRRLRPQAGVVGLALKILDALEFGHGRRGERAHGGDQKPRPVVAAILQPDIPAIAVFIEDRRGDPGGELDVAAQIELVGDIVEIALGLGLRREMLGPVPVVEQLLAEGIAVGIALRIEACAGIAVPVPGAADAGARLEHADAQIALPQPVELVEAGHAGADHDDVVIEFRVFVFVGHARFNTALRQPPLCRRRNLSDRPIKIKGEDV